MNTVSSFLLIASLAACTSSTAERATPLAADQAKDKLALTIGFGPRVPVGTTSLPLGVFLVTNGAPTPPAQPLRVEAHLRSEESGKERVVLATPTENPVEEGELGHNYEIPADLPAGAWTLGVRVLDSDGALLATSDGYPFEVTR